MKKWILRAFILVFFLTFIGVGSSSAAIILPQRPQQQNEEEQEALNGSCGVERWSVKTGTDADAGLINLQSTAQTTIAALISLPAPTALPANNRIQPTETTIFQVQATLTEYKLESDSDYHLILSDGSRNTMISEIPSPACVGSSSVLLPGIQNARSEFDAHYTATSNFQTANVPVIVTGVGFFDFFHDQTGVAPNGIELHAVLDVQFGTSGTPTPSPTSTITPSPTNTPLPTLTGTHKAQPHIIHPFYFNSFLHRLIRRGETKWPPSVILSPEKDIARGQDESVPSRVSQTVPKNVTDCDYGGSL